MSQKPQSSIVERDASTGSYHGWRAAFAEFNGALGDLGTFLPLVMLVLVTGELEAAPVMFGFALFAIVTGLVYRRPVPVQPMKAVAALIIVGQLSADSVLATGLLLGASLVLLSLTGMIHRLERVVPLSVLMGLQLALGAHLLWTAVQMAGTDVILASVLLLLLLLLPLLRCTGYGLLLLIAAGVGWSLFSSGVPASGPAVLMLPGWSLPSAAGWRVALETAYLPQLAMTLTNAVLLISLVAGDFYPRDRARLAPRNLALSSGLLNLLLAPLGALPMCHGAGGVAAHYRNGARTGVAPILFGILCLLLGVFAGPRTVEWMQLVPMPLLAAMLAFAGIQLINLPKLVNLRSSCYPAVAVVLLVSVGLSLSAGLIAGIAVEWLRSLSRRRGYRPT